MQNLVFYAILAGAFIGGALPAPGMEAVHAPLAHVGCVVRDALAW